MIDIKKYQIEIAEGHIEEAISGLIQDFNIHLTEDSSSKIDEMYNSVIQFSFRLNTISKRQFNGIISNDELYLERNKLTLEILEFLNFVNNSKDSFTEKKKITGNHKDDFIDLGFDFFLSFSSKDIDQVKNIASALRKEGFSVFASNDSLSSSVGKSYFDSIEFALKNSRNFLLLATPNSKKSEWVKTEWQVYFNEIYTKKPNQSKMFVFRGEGFKMEDLHVILSRFQTTDNIYDIIKSAKPSAAEQSRNIEFKPNDDPYNEVVEKGSKNRINEALNVSPGATKKLIDTNNTNLSNEEVTRRIEDKKKKSKSKNLLVSITVISTVIIAGLIYMFSNLNSSTNSPRSTHSEIEDSNSSAKDPSVHVPTGPLTSIIFDRNQIDFGTAQEGQVITRIFKFTNSGSEPLILSEPKASCGCTAAKFKNNKKVYNPGETGEVIVTFTTKNKKGKRNQKVTITANTRPAQTFIYMTGEVFP